MIAILTATVILVSSLGPLLYINAAVAADPSNWYRTVQGNLNTDTYSLYPFAPKNLTIGYSQFGELIDGNTKTGLFYGATDAFAPDTASPPESQWVEGWILNVTYVQGGQYRNVWALATYSDYSNSSGIGGNWNEGVTVGSLSLSVKGGRKTSGGAVTDPITVLYDGPRRYIGMTKTTIYDTASHDIALLSLTFYFDFNKVKKEVSIIKDVKRIDIGKNIGVMQIEFGDRGEWDLGAGSPPKSYAHFYFGNTTEYDHNWQPWYVGAPSGYDGTYDVCQIIDDDKVYAGWAAFWPRPITSWVGATQEEADRPAILTTITTITEDQLGTGSKRDFHIALGIPTVYPQNSSSGIHWIEDPMVFVDGEHRTVVETITDASRQCIYDRDNNNVTFPEGHAPALNSVVRMVYKVNKSKADMSSEPNSPFVIGEWAFEMHEPPSQFRGVTVYGIGDIHNGNDLQAPQGANVLDREVNYQLNEIFNPWDLEQAIEKKTDRWVAFTIGSTSWDSSSMTDVIARRPVMDISDANWDQYGMFSERVEDLNTSALLHRIAKDPLAAGVKDYSFTVDASGYAHITGLTATHYYKIMYSTNNTYQKYGNIELFNTTYSDIQPQANGTILYRSYSPSSATWNDSLNVVHTVSLTSTVYIENSTAMIGNHTFSANWTWNLYSYDFKVFKESVTSLGIWYFDLANKTVTDTSNSTAFALLNNRFLWTIDGPDLRDLHVDWLDPNATLVATVTYNATSGNFTVNLRVYASPWQTSNIMYQEWIPGRYEWGVVGRDAASVDSAGLSLVSAAFKNKQVEYGLAGEDMYDTSVANQMPWVMNRIGTATEVPHTFTNYYYYNYGEAYANDYRVALRDDWCTTWPVTTSNMISVGGPLANQLSYYENDFGPAFYGLSQFTSDSVWQNHIVAAACWMPHDTSHAYTSTNTTGYGVITTYLDINDTEVLSIWGVWGRDTYYLTKWFHEVGIYQLQQAPDGLTSIVVKITYASYPEGYKPTGFSIVECLGTISERLWIHGTESKGGIHDP
jgi:hypothetical protein